MKASLFTEFKGFLLSIAAALVLASRVYSADASAMRHTLVEAINSGATYAARVLLDPQGKSKCDYSITEGVWSDYEPPWHTGQIIYALIRAYEVTGNEEYLAAARLAGDWWIGLQIQDHPRLDGMVRAEHGAGIHAIVFATVSDGTAGLFRLYDHTKHEPYAKVPTQAGKWMLNNMWHPKERVFYDCVDPETGEVMKQWSPFWEDKKDQLLFDVARPNNEGSLYLDLYKYTQDEKFKKLFLSLCDSLVEKQGAEGVWMDFTPNDKSEGYYHPRFALWYAESLLDGYELTQERRYLEAALRTARVFARQQDKHGIIYYRNYLNGREAPDSISGSAMSFAGIVWLQHF